MDDGALEALSPRELGRVAGLVVVIPRAPVEEAAREALDAIGLEVARLDRPARVLGGEARSLDAVSIPDVLIDLVLFGRLLDVFEDGGPVGDGLLRDPRLEDVTERVHIRVGADAGVAEEIPRAAHPLASFEDDVALSGAAGLEVNRRADAREAGADDEDVEVVSFHEQLLELPREGEIEYARTTRRIASAQPLASDLGDRRARLPGAQSVSRGPTEGAW